MTHQDAGHSEASPSSPSAATSTDQPEPGTATQETSGPTQPTRSQPRTYRIEVQNIDDKKPPSAWQVVRENIKDVVFPFVALAVTLITWYYGYQLNERSQKLAQAELRVKQAELRAKNDEARAKILKELTGGTPTESLLAANFLAEQGEEALPTIYDALHIDDLMIQNRACETVKVMLAILKTRDQALRTQILDHLVTGIETGDSVNFQAGVKCAALVNFTGGDSSEAGRFVEAIEKRLGHTGEHCDSARESDESVRDAIIAESNFTKTSPVAGNAPGFLLGIIQNCKSRRESENIQETAANQLCDTFKAAYKENWKDELPKSLLKLEISDALRKRIDAIIGNPLCPNNP